MALAKISDAELLYVHGRFSNAYYLAGYAVEIGLKACIAAQIAAETIPDKTLLQKVFNHKYAVLVGLAGLVQPLKQRQEQDDGFAANWGLVGEWDPDCRYQTRDAVSAEQMLEAINDPRCGVLEWIRQYW